MARNTYVDDATGRAHLFVDAPAPAAVLERGVCRYCTCKDDEPCDGGCAWFDDAHTVCTTCRGAESIAEQIVAVFAELAQQATVRIRLISAPWADLTLEQKRLLVATARAAVELVADTFQAAYDDEGAAAVLELHAIGDFIRQRAPQEITGEELASQVVIRLLTPHIGSRIVLP